MCVLLVEDELMIREVMAETLQDAGFEVLEARNGDSALELLRNPPRKFTILVTDFHMPGDADGAQVAARIRSLIPAIPVIIATGRPEVLKASWREDFGYHLLKKPYLPSHLVQLVHSLLPRQRTDG